MAGPVSAEQMKEFATVNLEAADFMLFAEIGENLYTVVTLED